MVVLLHLEHNHSVAQGMHRSSLDQHPLPDLGLEAGKVIVRRPRGEAAQISRRRVRFQPAWMRQPGSTSSTT